MNKTAFQKLALSAFKAAGRRASIVPGRGIFVLDVTGTSFHQIVLGEYPFNDPLDQRLPRITIDQKGFAKPATAQLLKQWPTLANREALFNTSAIEITVTPAELSAVGQLLPVVIEQIESHRIDAAATSPTLTSLDSAKNNWWSIEAEQFAESIYRQRARRKRRTPDVPEAC